VLNVGIVPGSFVYARGLFQIPVICLPGKISPPSLLDLGYNKFPDGSEAVKVLPESTGNLNKLSWLNLRHLSLQSLPDSFGKLTGLVYLDLALNHLTELPDYFREFSFLEYLDLE
jgi:Leucine-rich repeat (LRR) protein